MTKANDEVARWFNAADHLGNPFVFNTECDGASHNRAAMLQMSF